MAIPAFETPYCTQTSGQSDIGMFSQIKFDGRGGARFSSVGYSLRVFLLVHRYGVGILHEGLSFYLCS
jgi:hypothetical protein